MYVLIEQDGSPINTPCHISQLQVLKGPLVWFVGLYSCTRAVYILHSVMVARCSTLNIENTCQVIYYQLSVEGVSQASLAS